MKKTKRAYGFASQPLLDTPKPRNARLKVVKKPARMKQYGDKGYKPSNGRGVGY